MRVLLNVFGEVGGCVIICLNLGCLRFLFEVYKVSSM